MTIKKENGSGNMLITGGKVSQEETRQAEQYNPNKYMTEFEFKLETPVELTNLAEVAKVSKGANALMGLATIVNRKSQIRDGVLPITSKSIIKNVKDSKLKGVTENDVVQIGTEQDWVKTELAGIKNTVTAAVLVNVNEDDLLEVN